MQPPDLNDLLSEFAEHNNFKNKGTLCVALVVTDHAKERGMPLNPDQLLAPRGGQVLGLGKSAVQGVLARHGITRVLAQEGGRTSRGSIDNMRSYVALLNSLTGPDLDAVERFWVGRVKLFFAGRPFRIRLDQSKGLRSVVRDILNQAEARHRDSPGTYYAGSVLQHLVGAKLDCALGEDNIDHHSYSTSDAQSGRAGDFVIGDVAIHVTTTPGEAVIGRCNDNLDAGLRPVLVTLQRGLQVAEGLASNVSLADRIDVFEAEQFIALNIYELGRFEGDGRRVAIEDLVDRYNAIIDAVETDPSLKISVQS